MYRRRNASAARKPSRSRAKSRKPAGSSARSVATKAYDRSGADSYKDLKAWIRQSGTKEMKTLLSGKTKSSDAFRDQLRMEFHRLSSMQRGDFNNPASSVAYKRRATKRHSSAWEDAPSSLSKMGKSADGSRTWDVTSAHNTPWRYQLRHLDDGWVVGFKSRRKGSKSKYIVPSGTAVASRSDHRVYYRTQKEAFRGMIEHIISGKHLAFKYNRGRSRR